ncbi:MAG TPA: hypothetical protein VFS44_07810 [Gemmatimonadaceae bacterium]|nr:hypothetical protein [Gemmatimonadaceae bacterium]
MSRNVTKEMRLLRRGALGCALASMLAGATACGGGAVVTGTEQVPIPPAASGNIIAALEGTVDSAGNVSFARTAPPVGAATLAPGVSAQFYGSQNVNVRLYSTPTVIDTDAATGKKRWRFDVGIRNLLPYPIGSDQSGAAPADTMGVTVFFTTIPTVTGPSPCTGCALAITNADGTDNFTAVGQPYYYWHERIGAVAAAPSTDTTLGRRTFTFEGTPTVTNFRFVVLVSAAWPPPNDARWKVSYDATSDSLPDTQASPPWKKAGILQNGSATWATGALTMNAGGGNDVYFFRRDSLAAATPAYMEAKLTLANGAPKDDPSAIFGFVDGTRLIALGVAKNRVGFAAISPITNAWTMIGTPAAVGGTTAHVYRLTKNGSSAATITVDGQTAVTVSYNALPTGTLGALGATQFFGASVANGHASSTSTWSYLSYELGVTAP